ncbi:hypothetical protein Tco_1147229 [Tanacetum coccineum]
MSVRRALQLKDAKGTECLPNATIFAELERMGYENLTQKLTFYKAFFSPQWKFLIYTILQCLSAKTTAWNEFSSTMASAIICLATNQKFNFSKYIFDNMVKNLEGRVKFLMYPRFVQVFLDKQVGDMFTHNRTYDAPSQQEEGKEPKADEAPNEGNVTIISNDPLLSGEDRLQLNELMELCTTLQSRVLTLETTKTNQALEINSLKRRVKKLETKKKSRTHVLKRLRKVGSARRVEFSDEASLGDQEDASKHGRKIADIDDDAEVTVIDETQGRNDDNLMFDTELLADHLELLNGNGVTLMFDQHKGLIEAVKEVMSFTEHRQCARHIYEGFRKQFGGVEFRGLFWVASKASYPQLFNKVMEKIKISNPRAHDYLVEKEPKTCSRAFFNEGVYCEAVENGFSESQVAHVNLPQHLAPSVGPGIPVYPKKKTKEGMVDSQPMEEEFRGVVTRDVGMETHEGPTEPVLQMQKTPSPSPAFIKENIDVLRTMIKEHDQQAKMKATPRKLAYVDSNKEAPAGKSQRIPSKNKEPTRLRRSRRLEDRSITKEKARRERSKPKGKRSGHQETSLDSEREEDSVDACEDLNSPYKRPKPTPFTQRITRFKYHRRGKLPQNIRVYEGNNDPKDYLGIFSAAAEQEE